MYTWGSIKKLIYVLFIENVDKLMPFLQTQILIRLLYAPPVNQ